MIWGTPPAAAPSKGGERMSDFEMLSIVLMILTLVVCILVARK